ncbi:MAG TPA: aquaporin, partial [Pirellulaceae bacterium]
MGKYIVELLGTFFLVTTIGCVVIEPGAGGLAPIAIGAALMVMVFAGGHVSGAHYNPAVTLAVFFRGKCPALDVIPYVVAQVAGAAAAAFVVGYLKPTLPAAPLDLADHVPQAFAAEFLFTFALAWVV